MEEKLETISGELWSCPENFCSFLEANSDCTCRDCPYTFGQKECPYRKLSDRLDKAIVNGETSDGFHTFNELYHHRGILFSVIVKCFKHRAWKSKQHSDGTMFGGMFIVGIQTPEGQATYHYDMNYWDKFDCQELEIAPEWDGHSPDDAISRIESLKDLVKN